MYTFIRLICTHAYTHIQVQLCTPQTTHITHVTAFITNQILKKKYKTHTHTRIPNSKIHDHKHHTNNLTPQTIHHTQSLYTYIYADAKIEQKVHIAHGTPVKDHKNRPEHLQERPRGDSGAPKLVEQKLSRVCCHGSDANWKLQTDVRSAPKCPSWHSKGLREHNQRSLPTPRTAFAHIPSILCCGRRKAASNTID